MGMTPQDISEIAQLKERIEELQAELEQQKLDAIWWEHAAFTWKAEAEDKTPDQAREDWVQQTLDAIPIVETMRDVFPDSPGAAREGAD